MAFSHLEVLRDVSYFATLIRPFLYAIRPAAVAADKTVETLMNFRKPPTEGRFLSQKVVEKGSAGISCWEDRKMGGYTHLTQKLHLFTKNPKMDSPTKHSGSGCQI